MRDAGASVALPHACGPVAAKALAPPARSARGRSMSAGGSSVPDAPPLAIPADVGCLADYERHAQARLPAGTWAFLNGGAGDECTLRDNRAAFERLRLAPRVLEDLRGGHTRCELLGSQFAHPILLAPVALQRLVHPEGERAAVQAAAALGGGCVVSTQASVGLEVLAQDHRSTTSAGSAPAPWFQLYMQARQEDTLTLVRRAEAAGYGALVLTVDAPVQGLREREHRAGFNPPPEVEAVNLRGMAPLAHRAPSLVDSPLFGAGMLDSAPTWQTLDWLRARTALPLVLKGILGAHDAERAVQAGAAALIVSNHGGRTLDGLPATLDALPRVVQAVQGRVPVLMDGGIRRGTDVFKALALGASAVLIGRPYVHALAVAGGLGVAHALHLLRAELEVAMVLAGCRTLAQIDASRIWR